MIDELASLATEGVIRAAINTGNKALVQVHDGELHGISPALARRLASEIGAELQPVVYDGAGKVFADAVYDAWDVGFLAIDEIRSKTITFTRPYIVIEATYAVRASSGINTTDDVDHPGRTVVLSSGSAYDMHLTDTLQHAAIERSSTPAESIQDFRLGRGDAVAGVRETLEGAFRDNPDFRILSGGFKKVEQAMVLPRRGDPRIAVLDDFVQRAVEDEFVVNELKRRDLSTVGRT